MKANSKTVATYVTSRGNVALEVTRHTGHDGHVTYSYDGKHGAGSGHGLEHVKSTVRVMLATHKGIKLSSGWDMLNEPAPSPSVVPVKVLGGEILALAARVDDGGPFVEFGQSYGELTMVARFNGGTHQQKLEVSDMIVDSCFKARSHAAHLAKIQALTEALELCSKDLSNCLRVMFGSDEATSEGLDAARAALALGEKVS